MAPHLLTPSLSVKDLVPEHKSSSSPTFSTDSPTSDPSFSPSSPSEYSGPVSNRRSDLTLSSSASSSFRLVSEIAPTLEHEGPRRRRKPKKDTVAKESQKHSANLELPNEERCKQLTQQRGSEESEEKGQGCHDSVCCKCIARLTVDCAAVCCCPLALLNLAALTFIGLPTSVAWKMLVNLKNRIYPKRRTRPGRDIQEESPRPKFNYHWSNGSSPEGNIDMERYKAKFDSQNLWQHFDAGRLDFGGLSLRKDHGNVSSMKNG